MQEEIWKVYPYKTKKTRLLEASNKGNIRLNGKLKKFNYTSNKYYYRVCKMYVHHIIAELFVPNPDNKPEIDHIDTNRHNNNADNLRWVTRKENLNNPQTKENYSKIRKGKFWGNWNENTLQNLRNAMKKT